MYHIDKEILGKGEEITLKDTADSYFKSIEIFGNSVQEVSTQGKQLLDPKDFNASQTVNGVAFTNNGNGTWNIKRNSK